MAGLYQSKNLGEVDLNLSDALQKLYAPGIQNDIRLFAFSNSLYSEIASAILETDQISGTSSETPREIYGMVNEPYTDGQGNIIKRTKFFTNRFTYSSENRVFFSDIRESNLPADFFKLDRREGFFDVNLTTNPYLVSGSTEDLKFTDLKVVTGDQLHSLNPVSNQTTIYYIIQPNINPSFNTSFKLSLTPGGTPLTITPVILQGLTSTRAKLRKFGDFGASIKYSGNGEIVNLAIKSAGKGYVVKNRYGETISTKTTVIVTLRGSQSGASSARARITITPQGSISQIDPIDIIAPGSGYSLGETLEIVTACVENRYGVLETPETHKCFQNTFIVKPPGAGVPSADTNVLIYAPGLVGGSRGLLTPLEYTYVTKAAGNDGFFLFDENTSKWVYLGETYNALFKIPASPSSRLKIKRYDRITAKNLLNLKSLNSTSFLYSYEESFSVSTNLSAVISAITDNIASIRSSFKDLIQNNKRQRLVNDNLNTLGTQFNIFEGKNFDSEYRLIMRDPDGILDRTDVDFNLLTSLQAPDQVELTLSENGIPFSAKVPGIYLDVGGVYKRIYSTDDKPFLTNIGFRYISPKIHKITGPSGADYNDSVITWGEVNNSGENKYSISTAYLPFGKATTLGFDTYISSLTQNLSNDAKNGGFVFYKQLQVDSLNNGIKKLPIFGYRSGANLAFTSVKVLGVVAS